MIIIKKNIYVHIIAPVGTVSKVTFSRINYLTARPLVKGGRTLFYVLLNRESYFRTFNDLVVL